MKKKKKQVKTVKTAKSPKKAKAVKTKSELELMNLKVSRKDREALKAQAKKYANGNLSAWLRYAGTNCKPPKSVHIS